MTLKLQTNALVGWEQIDTFAKAGQSG